MFGMVNKQEKNRHRCTKYFPTTPHIKKHLHNEYAPQILRKNKPLFVSCSQKYPDLRKKWVPLQQSEPNFGYTQQNIFLPKVPSTPSNFFPLSRSSQKKEKKVFRKMQLSHGASMNRNQWKQYFTEPQAFHWSQKNWGTPKISGGGGGAWPLQVSNRGKIYCSCHNQI